jgi:hypothetical protein
LDAFVLDANVSDAFGCIVDAPDAAVIPPPCACNIEGPTVCTCTDGYPNAPLILLAVEFNAVEPPLGPWPAFPADVAPFVFIVLVTVDGILWMDADEAAESDATPAVGLSAIIKISALHHATLALHE